MTTRTRLGDTEDGIANVDIAANLCVKWHTTAGQIVVCGVGDIPCGVTHDPIPAGKTGSFDRWGRGNSYYVYGTGIVAGDYVKCAAAGALAQEATATTPTVSTVGQCKRGSDSVNNIEVTSTR